ncbi:hypothetical protein [Gimesia maris]|uniref:hypothetical protein n=1 Tax=Gimesia maris TaxID=122 RepID=UPI0030DB0714
MNEKSVAFGMPGIEPRWTSSAKDGVGTAYHSSSRVWFTLSHGIVNEIYFPHVDTPNTRDLQFLITDGESFCHEERRDLLHQTEYPEQNSLFYRLTNSDREGRHRLVKEIVVAPHSSVLLMHTRLEIMDESLRGKLRLFALLAPHVKGTGKNNSAMLCGLGGRKLFEVQRKDIDMSFGCAPDFARRSVGYVGFSDGWRDLMDNFNMDWEFGQAEDGNVALIGEIDLSDVQEFTLGVGFGHNSHSACTHLLQALATPFADQREKYIRQWQRTRSEVDWSAHTKDGGTLMCLSQCVLLAHEDKTFQGAFVASLSIPWGDTKDDSDSGGYHLVWARHGANRHGAAGLRANVVAVTRTDLASVYPGENDVNKSINQEGNLTMKESESATKDPICGMTVDKASAMARLTTFAANTAGKSFYPRQLATRQRASRAVVADN